MHELDVAEARSHQRFEVFTAAFENETMTWESNTIVYLRSAQKS
jgi:hypothetical protein